MVVSGFTSSTFNLPPDSSLGTDHADWNNLSVLFLTTRYPKHIAVRFPLHQGIKSLCFQLYPHCECSVLFNTHTTVSTMFFNKLAALAAVVAAAASVGFASPVAAVTPDAAVCICCLCLLDRSVADY